MGTRLFGRGEFLGTAARSIHSADFCVELRIATLPPDQVLAHTHQDAHFILAIDSGYRSLASDSREPSGRARPGMLIWNPPGVEHDDCFDEAGSRFLSLSFDAPKGTAQGAPRRLHGEAKAAAHRLLRYVAEPASGSFVDLEGAALAVMSYGLTATELSEDPEPHWVSQSHIMILDMCMAPGLEVREVAASLGVHPVSLARRYRRHFGQSPTAAIRQARAGQAMSRLRRSADLARLAVECGYADQSHMTREFGAVFGATPAHLRAALV